MRVRIYRKDQAVVVETHFIRDVNTVAGFALHESCDPDIGIEIQAEPGQIFTLEGADGGFLCGFEAGHVIGHDPVVWDDRPEPETDCPRCGASVTFEEA